MSSPSVRTFGKYLLDEEIARGGMSRVYSARLRGLGGFEKRLVVKQVLPELASDPRFVAMFVHEAKTLVQMSHPHIAPVYELGVVDGVYFLAMEFVEGATLAAILRDGPLAPGLVAHLGAEICDALHYAHSRFDIVHRDVTPRNVIVDGGGHSRLLDFGIAAPLSDEDAELFGTPGYLSPEQLAGGAIGAASDVFSLGAVIFEALTGRRAFEARTLDETRVALEAEGPAFTASDGVPDALAPIVLRALGRDPAERFGSARELGRALRGWLASEHPEGVAPELGVRAERAEREDRRRLSLAPATGAVAEPATKEVRTIATSRALDALLVPDAEEVCDSGTVRIEGRRAGTDGRQDERGDDEHEREDEHEHEHEVEGDEVASGRGERQRSIGDPARRQSKDARVPAESATARTSMLPWAIAAVLLALLGLVLWPGTPESTEPLAAEPVSQPPRADPPRRELAREVVAVGEPPPAPPPVTHEETPTVAAEEPAPRRAATVPLTVSAMPWAEVSLDGRALGQTPQRSVPVRPGRHTLELSCPPLGREVRYTFDAVAGQPVTLHGDLSTAPPIVRRVRRGGDQN